MRMMEAIANELGVKLGNPFVVENRDKLVTGMFEFTEDDLVRTDSKAPAPGVLGKLVAGKYRVVEHPVVVAPPESDSATWEPEPGEKYWFILLPAIVVDKATYSSPVDWMRYKMGNCYRTREEARKHKEEWGEDFTRFLDKTEGGFGFAYH